VSEKTEVTFRGPGPSVSVSDLYGEHAILARRMVSYIQGCQIVVDREDAVREELRREANYGTKAVIWACAGWLSAIAGWTFVGLLLF
jgi:hypothetical protein